MDLIALNLCRPSVSRQKQDQGRTKHLFTNSNRVWSGTEYGILVLPHAVSRRHVVTNSLRLYLSCFFTPLCSPLFNPHLRLYLSIYLVSPYGLCLSALLFLFPPLPSVLYPPICITPSPSPSFPSYPSLPSYPFSFICTLQPFCVFVLPFHRAYSHFHPTRSLCWLSCSVLYSGVLRTYNDDATKDTKRHTAPVTPPGYV